LIDTHNLVILNDCLLTILLPPNARRSIIDLVLVSFSLAPLCRSYTDDTGSDHFPVFTSIGNSFCKESTFAYKLEINKKDMALLRHNLYDSNVNFRSYIFNDTIVAYHQFEQHIKLHLHAFFPPGSRFSRNCVIRSRPP